MIGSRPMRILDFDIENRPSSYWYDRPSAEVTAIAWAWVGDTKVSVAMLEPPPLHEESMRSMLKRFVEAYNMADMVAGHYITRHDLPILCGALLENDLPILGPKLAQDTKTQLVKHQDLPVSQEALAEFLGIKKTKYHMTQPMWREANRLTPEGRMLAAERVSEDVLQNMEMREELIRRNLLKPPKVWRP